MVEKYLDLKEKELVNSINLTNFGILGIIFFSLLLFVNVQNFETASWFDWAIIAIAFSIFTGCLIWGLIGFREREVNFKKDKKTKSITALGLLLNILGLTLTAIGEFLLFSLEDRLLISPEGDYATFAFQGFAVMLVGGIILASTFYLYKRFIPQLVIWEPEMGNTQTVSSL